MYKNSIKKLNLFAFLVLFVITAFLNNLQADTTETISKMLDWLCENQDKDWGTWETSYFVPSMERDSLGNKEKGANQGLADANLYFFGPYEADENGLALNIYFYFQISNGYSGNINLALYDDNNGTPGDLLETAYERSFTSGDPEGWNKFTLKNPVNLVKNEKYWIASKHNTHSLFKTYYDTTSGTRIIYIASSYPENFPAVASWASSYNREYPMYIDYIKQPEKIFGNKDFTVKASTAIGNREEEASSTEHVTGYSDFYGPYECEHDGISKAVCFYISSRTPTVKFAVYSDNEGYPLDKLVESEELSVQTSGWIRCELNESIPVFAGNKYWLAKYANAGTVYYPLRSNSSEIKFYQIWGGLPGTFPVSQPSYPLEYSIYLEYDPYPDLEREYPKKTFASGALKGFGPYEAQEDLFIESIYFYAGYTGTETNVEAKFAVYSDNDSNYPDEKLGETSAVSISEPGWVEFELSSPVSIERGTKYWFCALNVGGTGSDDFDYYSCTEYDNESFKCFTKNSVSSFATTFPEKNVSITTQNEEALVHAEYSFQENAQGENEIINTDIVSQSSLLANLALTRTLLNASYLSIFDNDHNAALENALYWVETQEFNNTEYLARQIEILALSNRNSDLFLEKLLTLQNEDGGWGENKGYQSNPTDTNWALKAMLAAGIRNDELISETLSSLLIQSSYDNDSFRWSYFKPNSFLGFSAREDSIITTTEIFFTLKEYSTYLSTLCPVTYNDLLTSIEDFLLTELDNDNILNLNWVQDAALLTSVLRRYGIEDNEDNVAATITALENLCTGSYNYLTDPYLTALILNSLCESQRTAAIINTIGIVDNTITASLSTSSWNDAEFYYKPGFYDKFILFSSESNSPESLSVTSDIIPFPLKDGDLYGVLIDNKVWKEDSYVDNDSQVDVAVYNKDLNIYYRNLNGELTHLPGNISLKSTLSQGEAFYIAQKIYNLSDKKLENIIITTEIENENDSTTIDLLPNEIYNYYHILAIDNDTLLPDKIDLSSLPTSIDISIQVSVANDQNSSNNSTQTELFFIEFDCETISSYQLDKPENLDYEVIENNLIRLFWDAPLDSNVTGYYIKTEIYDNDTSYTKQQYTTIETSLNFNITRLPTVFYVHSIDVEGNISAQCENITINTDSFSDLDTNNPIASITYPTSNQIISSVKSSDDSDSYGFLSVLGTANAEKMFSHYKVELLYDNNTPVLQDIYEPDNKSAVNTGLLALIDLDNETIESGSYKIKLTSYDMADNNLSYTVPVTIYKWNKKLAYEGNNCSSPSFNSDATELMFSSTRHLVDKTTDGFVNNLWIDDDLDNDSSLLNKFTENYTNDLEPDWIADDKVLFSSYRTGSRNLVFKDNESEEKILNVVHDNEGNHNFSFEIISLVDEDGAQIYYPKSFYNADYISVTSTLSYILASDEEGEIVLIGLDNDSPFCLEQLTCSSNLSEDKKQFVLADKPKFGNLGTNNECKVLFEGYDIQLPDDYAEEDFYINCDIYTLDLSLDTQITEFELGYDDETDYSTDQPHTPNYLSGVGPYCAPDDSVAYSVEFYSASTNANGVLKCAIYLDNDGTPGLKLAETEAITGIITGWNTCDFSENVQIHDNESYWIVYLTNAYLNLRYKTDLDYSIKQFGFSSLDFPDQFQQTGLNIADSRKYCCYVACKSYTYDFLVDNSLENLTNTPKECEISPIWIGDNISPTIENLSILYISDKDITGIESSQWNIYFGDISSTLKGVPICNTSTNDGILDYLDLKSNKLAYEETLLNPVESSSAQTNSYVLGDDTIPTNGAIFFEAGQFICYGPYSAVTDGIAKDILFYIKALGNTDIRFAVYTDNDGYPYQKIEETASVSLQKMNEPDWIKFTLKTKIYLRQNEKYWLVEEHSAHNQITCYRKTSTERKIIGCYAPNGDTSVFPDEMLPQSGSRNEEYHLYMEYSSVPTGYLGTQSEYLTDSSSAENQLSAVGPYKASEDGEIEEIYVYLQDASNDSAEFKLAVYQDDGSNYPGDKISETETVTLALENEGWYKISFDEPYPVLSRGSSYWFVFNKQNTTYNLKSNSSDSDHKLYYFDYSYSNNLPDNYVQQATDDEETISSTNCGHSIYLIYRKIFDDKYYKKIWYLDLDD